MESFYSKLKKAAKKKKLNSVYLFDCTKFAIWKFSHAINIKDKGIRLLGGNCRYLDVLASFFVARPFLALN